MDKKTTLELVDGDVIITNDGSRVVRYVKPSDTFNLERNEFVYFVTCYYVPGLAFGYSGLAGDKWQIAAHIDPTEIIDPQPEVPGLIEVHLDGNARMFNAEGEISDHQADVVEDQFWGRHA